MAWALAWAALSSHRSSVRYAASWAETNRIFENKWPPRFAAKGEIRLPVDIEKHHRLRRHGAIFGGAERQHVHPCPPRQVRGRRPKTNHRIGEPGAIHVNTDPSRLGHAGQGHDFFWRVQRPGLGGLGQDSAAGCILWGPWGVAPSMAAPRSAGVSFPCSQSRPTMRAPPVNNSGAPHSSWMTWASAWQYTAPYGGANADRAKAFAAVPVPKGNTATSRSNTSANCPVRPAVVLSSP